LLAAQQAPPGRQNKIIIRVGPNLGCFYCAQIQIGPLRLFLGQFFYFYILYFCFLQKYIFDLEIYKNIPRRPAAGRPGPGRPAAGRQGLCAKTFAQIIARRSLGAGRQAAGRPAPLAARQLGGRPWPTGCWAIGSPTLI